MTLLFWRPEYDEKFEDAHPFDAHQFGDADDLVWAAEQFAEYHHDNRDGWEDSWPITFNVSKEDGTLLGTVSVEIEARPHFIGRKKK